MNNQSQELISRMRAITISRQYGSGGGEIGLRLAARLGWRLIDHEVVVRVAQELGVSEAEAAAFDERAEGLLARLLSGVQLIEPAALVASSIPVITDPKVYTRTLRSVVEAAAANRHVVIIGRGSQVLLANQRDVLHARIVAPFDPRVAYVMEREGLDQSAARARVQLKDRDRMRYLQAEYHQNPHDALLYDLVVNTAVIDLDGAVDIIQAALEHKARQLGKSTQQLGPSAGLTRYTAQPGDFRPPE